MNNKIQLLPGAIKRGRVHQQNYLDQNPKEFGQAKVLTPAPLWSIALESQGCYTSANLEQLLPCSWAQKTQKTPRDQDHSSSRTWGHRACWRRRIDHPHRIYQEKRTTTRPRASILPKRIKLSKKGWVLPYCQREITRTLKDTNNNSKIKHTGRRQRLKITQYGIKVIQ